VESSELDIIVEDVTKSFGNLNALKGVDLRVKRGEFLTLFGPNGAGKTTLIRLLAALTKPTSGRVIVANHDIRKEPDRVRGLIGVISHDPYLYENLSAMENMRFFASLYGVSQSEKRSLEVIKQVGLESRMHDLVRTFSRGMKQRLAVARAIVHAPRILLLDEPYTGLDQHGVRVFGEMLRWLKEEKRTIFMTTHSLSEGLEMSDRVAILSGGRIVYEGDACGVELSSFKELYLERVGG
jgi:heme exporter protein A